MPMELSTKASGQMIKRLVKAITMSHTFGGVKGMIIVLEMPTWIKGDVKQRIVIAL
jgi:hypothetical protein